MPETDLGYRKIQKTGRESYIISLPKEWILYKELEKGDQLAVKKQEDSSLLLIPRDILEKREKTEKKSQKEFYIHITPKDTPQSIRRRLLALYVISADIIHIRFKKENITSEQKTSIKNTVRMLLGSEIIDESINDITIQILISHPEFPIEKAIRRMFAIAKSMDKESVSSLKNFNASLLQEIIDSEIDLDRLNLYVIRQLKYGIEHNLYKEMGFDSPKEFLGYRILVHNIENIGDTAVEIAKKTLDLKKMLGDKIVDEFKPIDNLCTRIIEFNSFCKTLLDTSLKALFKRDYDLADETIYRYASTGLHLEKESVDLMLRHTMAPNVAFLIRLVLSSSRKMMEYSRDIAEITLNRTVEEKSQ